MIVVDTSVWIDFFRGVSNRKVDVFVALVETDAGIAITDVILTEILRGLRSESDVRRVERRLALLEVLRLDDLEDFRRARQRSTAVRGVKDSRFDEHWTVFIASVCIREDVPLLHADADFDRLASCSDLQVA